MSEIALSSKKRNTIILVMLSSAFVAMLNQTLLNTALPAIITGLKITETTAQWLITGFMLVNGIMIPLTAFLMDRFHTRPLYIFSMSAFLIGSIIAALSPSFGLLMFARVIQAIGAGILLPLMQFTVFTLFPAEKRGFAMGLTGIVAQSAPAIGPTLTGFLIDSFSWRAPFLVVATIALIAFIIGAIFVESNNETKLTKLDKTSVVYSTFGFGLMLYAFSSAGNLGFSSPIVIISLILGIIIVGVFVSRQIRIDNPLLNMRVFANRTFSLSAFSSMVLFIGIVGPALLIPMYIQTGLGLSAILSGLVILPGAVVNAFMSVYTGKIFDKYGLKVLAIPGFILLIIMTILHCFLTVDTPYWYVVVIYAVRMFAVALIIMPLNTIGINALDTKNISHGTAIMNSLRIIAGAIGTAIMITIMAIVRTNYANHATQQSKTEIMQHATVLGVDAAFAFTTVLLIIGFVLTLMIRTQKR
ncbi:MDR family MFS transporter [Staphylococcus gallinarum]|jgi:DHA2 family multidrug resistance protein-like MFS transporter|uniref:DHA2 family efflux MFS transporter permease subunit n=1 Tax=Staphylococcus gallinarum TaxID=1293 RepID=A0A418HII4_STAGA|nr:MDR family MFS transporter [Staphylococcus gallinarum]KIR12598.1 multidrug MFS transporter [Staphylococcus gallinarum]MBU7216489.1 multidrug efflux MFS transporter [Staphylococcus gallinarum]MCD8785852.1 multidrug efflux MFS transporter [Staphylococcus gallinarum]MCD8793652.1 multidrug efflux MFS transporter [Staphylococcus gallinarum]MCD8826268.1 multidrug efflux MFS transporter [Staphylococcus gallinarum]